MPDLAPVTFAEVELAKKPGPFTAWAARGNDCGGGTGPLIGYYSDEATARVVAKDKNRGPGDGAVEKVSCVRIGDQVYLLAHDRPLHLDEGVEESRRALRAKILSKLTPDELAFIGVEP